MLGDRKSRIVEINNVLRGNADVGSKQWPNREGVKLLHERALFVSELEKQHPWPG